MGHAPARGIHVLASEIYTHAYVGCVPTHGGWIGKRMAATRSGGSPDHCGVVRVVVELSKADRSYFEKKKSNLTTLGRGQIRGWGQAMEAANKPLEVEEEPVETLNQDKASNEAS